MGNDRTLADEAQPATAGKTEEDMQQTRRVSGIANRHFQEAPLPTLPRAARVAFWKRFKAGCDGNAAEAGTVK